MAVFPGRTTRGALLDLALKKAGNKKILGAARLQLNRELEALYTQHEWPFLYVTVQAVVNGGSMSLPTDFLKAAPDFPLMGVALDNVPTSWEVPIVAPAVFLARASQSPDFDVMGDRPLIARVDYPTGTVKCWPGVTTSVALLALTYKHLPADVDPENTTTYDADVPLFPFTGYLTDAMEVWAMEYERDPRAPQAKADLSAALGRLLGTAIPVDAPRAAALDLDPQVFLRPFACNEE